MVFQVLCESGLLPGVLIRNEALKFRCKWVNLHSENTDTRFTNSLLPGEVIKIPIAHGEGLYMADAHVIEELEANKQIVFPVFHRKRRNSFRGKSEWLG